MTGIQNQDEQAEALKVLLEWSQQVAPEHFGVAITAAEAQMARNHEWRMEQARFASDEAEARRLHSLHLFGMAAGFLLAAGMLTGAVIVGANGEVWLAALLSGPSVLSLAALFVLRRIDSAALRQTARAHNAAITLAQGPAPAAAPPGTSPPV